MPELKRCRKDICFAPDGDYSGAIRRLTGKEYKTGLIKNTDGRILGTHQGIIRYTIGQRKGLGISSDRPLYVCSIDAENNEIVVGEEQSFYAKEVRLKAVNWVSPWLVKDGMQVKAKIRYRQHEQPAVLRLSSCEENEAVLTFKEPQRAITRGQAAVLYLGDIVLGGGRIM